MELPLHIIRDIFLKVSLVDVYPKLVGYSAVLENLLLSTRKPLSYIKPGFEVDPTYFPERLALEARGIVDLTQSERWFIIKTYLEGRVALCWDGSSKPVAFNGEQLVLKEEETVPDKDSVRFYVMIIGNSWKIVQRMKVVPFGCFVDEDFKFIHRNKLTVEFKSLTDAIDWLDKIRNLRPGDKVQRSDGKEVIVDYSFFDSDDVDNVPEWLFPNRLRKEKHYSTKEISYPLWEIRSITESKSLPCHIAGTKVYRIGDFAVPMVQGLPLTRIVNANDYGYSVEILRNQKVLHFTHNFPPTKVFGTMVAATDWRMKQLDRMNSAFQLLKPGDLVLPKTEKSKVGKLKYMHVLSIQKEPINKKLLHTEHLGLLDRSELSDDEDTIVPVSPFIEYYVTGQKQKWERKDIHDVQHMKDLDKITLTSSTFSKQVTIGVGFTISVRIGHKFMSSMNVDRIIHNGIVLNGTFYSANRVIVTYVSLSNPTLTEKRKSVEEMRWFSKKQKTSVSVE